MTLILNNDEITQLLPMADCLGQLDAAYRDLGEGNAISRTRSDIYGPIHDNGRYVFKTMDGMVPRFEAAAVRLNSDVIRWGAGPEAFERTNKGQRRGKNSSVSFCCSAPATASPWRSCRTA